MERIIIYYKSENKKCFIKDFIDSLNPLVQQKILWTLKLLKEIQFLKEPYFKKLTNTNDIWECRIKYGTNIYRILFFLDKNNTVILTHGFIKKTQKTPKNEIFKAEEIKYKYFKNKGGK